MHAPRRISKAQDRQVLAANLIEARKITFLVVREEGGQPLGILPIHDLLAAKVL